MILRDGFKAISFSAIRSSVRKLNYYLLILTKKFKNAIFDKEADTSSWK